jgi:Flp pilus assembly protein TadG
MREVLVRARDRFVSSEAGNVATIFAVAAVPLFGMLGGALDIARHQRYRAEFLNTMDAAAVALAKRGAVSDADATAFVRDFIAAARPARPGDTMLHGLAFNATEVAGGWRINSDGFMDTAFMGLVGVDRIPLDLTTEVRTTGGKYEVALALDNTGSMRNYGRMDALKEAADSLVDTLYAQPGAEDRVKVGLVPFVTAVNVKTDGVFQDSWIQASLDPALDMNFASPTEDAVDRLALFDQMHVAWKGCVEARRGADDEDDTPPANAETRWVPYLWPDEPDDRGYGNDYLDDSASGADWDRLRDVVKYDVPVAETPTDATNIGPNAACPRPIVELTNDGDRLHEEINLMKPHNQTGGNHSGTNVAQGLLWAWRVLSKEEPYSQGADYDDGETQKVLVLLSDGRNQVVSNGEVTASDYTSYGYLADGRMGSTVDSRVAEQTIDDKVGRICEKIKAKGIRLYTILVQVDFEETQDIFRACASTDDEGQPLYQYVPTAEALQQAFNQIGKDMTEIYVSR